MPVPTWGSRPDYATSFISSLPLTVHGCTALSQLQQVLRLNGQAHSESDSVVELFLQRLDEQGLEISSPWKPMPGRFIVDIL